MALRSFFCEGCQKMYYTDSLPEEAWAEYERNFPGQDREDVCSLCDDCYAKVLIALGKTS